GVGGFFVSSRRRHTRLVSDWSSDVCSSDLSDSGTPHVCAAAVTSIARAAAPTRRIGIQLIGVAVLPPADCAWNLLVSSGACSMRSEERRVGKEGRSGGAAG